MNPIHVLSLQVQKVATNLKLLSDLVTEHTKQLVVLGVICELLQEKEIVDKVDVEARLREKGFQPRAKLPETT